MDTVIQNAQRYIGCLFSGNSDGHGADHSVRVYRTAADIAAAYPDCDTAVVSLAALLHDADDPKLFNTRNHAHARSFLRTQGIEGDTADCICAVIDAVSFSKNRLDTPDTIEAQIVQDADRLDAIGAAGIARTFAYGGSHGRTLEQTVAHFHEKLLLLKDGMNTPEARSLAEQRHTFMLGFLEQLSAEISPTE